MSSYLDKTGLTTLWDKIKSSFVAQEDGMSLSSNDYTDEDKATLTSVSEKIDDYLPLSGGTMDKGATVALPYASDDRTLMLAPSGVRYQIPSSSTAALGLTWYENDGSGNVASQVGLYNNIDKNSRYLYFGGTYSEPLMKLTTDGQLSCSEVYADTFYEDSTSLALKYKKWKYGTVGSVSSVAQPYYKMASIEITSSYAPARISLKVTDGFNSNVYGILTVRVRTNSPATDTPTLASLYWEYLGGVNAKKDNYILAYKATDSGLLVEIWYHAPSTYNTIHFYEIMEAGDYTKQSQTAWTLYSGTGLGETEIDSDYTLVTSSLITLQNPVLTLELDSWLDMTLSAGSTNITDITLLYRIIDKLLFIKGSFTLSSSVSANATAYIASSTTIGDGDLFTSGSGNVYSTSGAGMTCLMYSASNSSGKMQYLTFLFLNSISSGSTIYFSMSGTID